MTQPAELSGTAYAAIIMLTGVLVAIACALPGTFLVLRRMSLIGDAISHAILPGIALGFILTHSRQSLVMLAGAAVAGLVTVWLVEALHRTRRCYEDAAIAVLFPALFALGVVMIDHYRYVDLDLDCVFQGDISNVPNLSLIAADTSLGPRALWVLALAVLLNLGLVIGFYKELKITTFDPQLAESLGYSPRRMHYLLMTAVSITTVAAFESVGAILVVGFLVVPPATAHLLTHRLSHMLYLAAGFGVLAAVTGYLAAREEVLDCSIPGAMASAAGGWFLLVWLLAPRHGLLAAWRRRREQAREFAASLLLVELHKHGTKSEHAPRRGRSSRFARRVLADLQTRGLIERSDEHLALTPAGRMAAVEIAQHHMP
jgi:manganese/zinc/iron transport system permease protein